MSTVNLYQVSISSSIVNATLTLTSVLTPVTITNVTISEPTNITYQWFDNFNPIPGATNSSYSTTDLANNQTYDLRVTYSGVNIIIDTSVASTISISSAIPGNVSFTGDILSGANITLSGNISGNITLPNTIAGTLDISDTVLGIISGTSTISGTLTIGTTGSINTGSVVNGNLTVSGTLILNGSTSVTSTISLISSVTLNDSANINGSFSGDGTIVLNNDSQLTASSFNSTISITGNNFSTITLNGTSTNKINWTGSLSLTGNSFMKINYAVTIPALVLTGTSTVILDNCTLNITASVPINGTGSTYSVAVLNSTITYTNTVSVEGNYSALGSTISIPTLALATTGFMTFNNCTVTIASIGTNATPGILFIGNSIFHYPSLTYTGQTYTITGATTSLVQHSPSLYGVAGGLLITNSLSQDLGDITVYGSIITNGILSDNGELLSLADPAAGIAVTLNQSITVDYPYNQILVSTNFVEQINPTDEILALNSYTVTQIILPNISGTINPGTAISNQIVYNQTQQNPTKTNNTLNNPTDTVNTKWRENYNPINLTTTSITIDKQGLYETTYSTITPTTVTNSYGIIQVTDPTLTPTYYTTIRDSSNNLYGSVTPITNTSSPITLIFNTYNSLGPYKIQLYVNKRLTYQNSVTKLLSIDQFTYQYEPGDTIDLIIIDLCGNIERAYTYVTN